MRFQDSAQESRQNKRKEENKKITKGPAITMTEYYNDPSELYDEELIKKQEGTIDFFVLQIMLQNPFTT